MDKLKFTLVIVFLVMAFTVSKIFLITHNRALQVKLPKVETVILGDSHARHALNPEFIDNSINLSQDSQNIIYSYYVLQKLIQSGNHPRNVVLAYSYHSLQQYYLKVEDSEMMRRYHLILDEDFYHNLAAEHQLSAKMRIRYYSDFWYVPLGISNDLYELFKIHPDKFRSFPYLGGFEQNPRAKLTPPLSLEVMPNASFRSQIQQNRNRKYLNDTLKWHYFNHLGSEISPVLALYLEKMAVLCRDNRITLYLVNTPVHPEYKKRIPANIINAVDSLANNLESKYYTVYLNYSDFKLDDKYFYDYDHLTTPGSKVFSEQLNRIIRFISTGEYTTTP